MRHKIQMFFCKKIQISHYTRLQLMYIHQELLKIYTNIYQYFILEWVI